MMKNKKIIIFVNYSLLFLLFIQQNLTTHLIPYNLNLVILLILFITSNLKIFYIANDGEKIFIVNLFDWLLYLLLFKITSFISPTYFLLPLINCFYFNKKNGIFLSIIGFSIYLYTVIKIYSNNIEEIMNYSILFLAVASLVYYIIYLIDGNKKLRLEIEGLLIKNNELMNSQKHIELYSESIEDLIALKERNRISREIHDSVGHGLSTIIIQLNALISLAKFKPDEIEKNLKMLTEFAKKNLEEVRFALRELKPENYNRYEPVLLIHTLTKEFQKMTGIFVQLSFSKKIWALTENQSHSLYKAVQEFLSNSAKYGKPSKIQIHFLYTLNSLIVTLQDNGIGCENIKKGIGLTAIEERIHEVGGSVSYESLPKVQGFFMRLSFINKDLKFDDDCDNV